jgi:putative transposase
MTSFTVGATSVATLLQKFPEDNYTCVSRNGMVKRCAAMQIHHMTSIPTLGYRSLRTGRRSLPGQLYLITTITWQRKPYFLDTICARAAARAISAAELWLPSRCLCWLLMPDHWHALIELGEDADLSTTMQRVKGVTAREVKRQCAIDGSLWAKGFHDHALRRDESVEEVARYIIGNPVRAGLVEHPMDYPYWDAYFIGNSSRPGDALLS